MLAALVARMTVIPFLTLGTEILKSIAKMKLGKAGDVGANMMILGGRLWFHGSPSTGETFSTVNC